MKRYIILVAAVALATVSCSKTYDTNKNAGEGMPITLRSWTNNLTRAREVGSSAFTSGDKFYVYSYTSGAQTPFDGTEVSFDGTDWTYSPLRFWDRTNDYYHFYGISIDAGGDLGDILASHNVTAGTFASKSLTWAGNDNDILVADSVKVLKAHYGEQVALNFRHISALFDLKVRKGAGIGDDGVVKVTSISLENIGKIGTFSVTGYDATTDSAVVSWGALTAGTYTGANGVKNTVDTDIISGTTAVTTTGDQYLINNLVVIPQDFAADAQRLKITYTITTGTGVNEQTNTFTDKTYDLILFDKTDYDSNNGTNPDVQNANPRVTGWAAGVHYTYIITIDAEAIKFTANMEPWAVDGGYYYILN